MPHPCRYALCKNDWDPTSHTASIDVTVAAVKDQIHDGDQEVHLAWERLMPGGGGPYLHVFTNYSLPETTVRC